MTKNQTIALVIGLGVGYVLIAKKAPVTASQIAPLTQASSDLFWSKTQMQRLDSVSGERIINGYGGTPSYQFGGVL